MRRTFPKTRLAAGVLLTAFLATCSKPEGRSDIAVEAGGASLTPAQLGEWVARVPGRQPTLRDAEFVATVWADYTLLAQALERGDSLTDPATVEAALLPDLGLQVLRAWHDTMVARRPRVAADRIDSIYAQDTVRVFQHVFFRVRDPQDVREVAAARAAADSIFAMARDSSADFAALAKARSEDPTTASTGGWLPVGAPGALPPEFERGAWRLAPGAVAGLSSRLGIHIVRRPPLAEARDRLTQYAESLATRQADARYLDSLTTAVGLAVSGQAVPSLRAFFANPSDRSSGTVALATWTGGELTLAYVARWIDLLPPRGYLDLRGASDLALEAFVKELAQQELMLAQARAAGIVVTPAERAALDSGYGRNLAGAVAMLGVSPGAALPQGGGAQRVAALLEGLTSDRERWRPLPGALSAVLRERGGYRLHQAGIAAALEVARATRATPQ
ncbi:MAG TPA: peptidylprolyl isomerase [Gemmatimonadales bacterium]